MQCPQKGNEMRGRGRYTREYTETKNVHTEEGAKIRQNTVNDICACNVGQTPEKNVLRVFEWQSI